jgi:hypothetical protein
MGNRNEFLIGAVIMFEQFNGDIGHNIHLILSWWAILGFFAASFLPPTGEDKRVALKQTFILGPLFWIGVPICGLFFFAKKSMDNTE